MSADLAHNSEDRGETLKPVSRTQTKNISGQKWDDENQSSGIFRIIFERSNRVD